MPDNKPAHRPGCSRPEPIRQTTAAGDPLHRCPECARYWFPESTAPLRRAHAQRQARTMGESFEAPPDTTAESTVETTVEPTVERVPASRYVCRDHYSPVRPNGRGCTHCARERAKR